MNTADVDSYLYPERPVDRKVFIFVGMTKQEASACAIADRNRVRASHELVITRICERIGVEQEEKEAKVLREHKEFVDSIKASGLDNKDCAYALGARQLATDRAISAIRRETDRCERSETAHIDRIIAELDLEESGQEN